MMRLFLKVKVSREAILVETAEKVCEVIAEATPKLREVVGELASDEAEKAGKVQEDLQQVAMEVEEEVAEVIDDVADAMDQCTAIGQVIVTDVKVTVQDACIEGSKSAVLCTCGNWS